MTTKQIGDVAEIQFVAWCVERGLGVALPLGDRLPYDVIVDVEGKLIKVQVKTAGHRNCSSITIPVTNTTTKKGKWTYKTYIGKVDLIIAYDHTTGKLYCLHPQDFANIQRDLYLRLKPSKNNQVKGVRFAKDYELTSVDQLG